MPFSAANISNHGSDSGEGPSDSDQPGLFCSRTSFSCTLAALLTRKRKSPRKMGLRKKKKTRIKTRHQGKCCLEVRCSYGQSESGLNPLWGFCWPGVQLLEAEGLSLLMTVQECVIFITSFLEQSMVREGKGFSRLSCAPTDLQASCAFRVVLVAF